MLQKIDKKKYIFFYLIIFLIFSSTHNLNFKYNNFFIVKKIEVVGLDERDNLLLEKKLKNLIGLNIFTIDKEYFKFIKSDVRDKKIILKEIKNQDYIIPLAALVGAPLCQKYPKKTKEVNLNAIKFIVKNLKKHQRIIYPNTNSGYGIGKKNTFCENPLNFVMNSRLQEKCNFEKLFVETANFFFEDKSLINLLL